MIKLYRTDKGKLHIEIELNHEIVDDCFKMNRLNSASEGKRLLMETIGQEFDKYVSSFAKTPDDLNYLSEEFKKININ